MKPLHLLTLLVVLTSMAQAEAEEPKVYICQFGLLSHKKAVAYKFDPLTREQRIVAADALAEKLHKDYNEDEIIITCYDENNLPKEE